MTHKCEETVSAPGNPFHSWKCDKTAKVTRGGKHYCGRHDPERPRTAAQIAATQRREREQALSKMRSVACTIADLIADGQTVDPDIIAQYRKQRTLARSAPKELR